MIAEEIIKYHYKEADINRAIAKSIENGLYETLMRYPNASVPISWIVSQLGISEQSANNQLKKLYDLGIVLRKKNKLDSGGSFYTYHWIASIGVLRNGT